MLKTRSIVLSLTVAALAVVASGCQRGPVEAAAPVADNTAVVCDDFRHFEVDHLGAGDSLAAFNTLAAADMTKLADRATDPTVSGQLQAIAAQISVLAALKPTQTWEEAELAHPEVFAAGGQAWVDLEGRCGKAVIPTP